MDAKWIVNLSGKDYVLYGGILDCAHKAGLVGIETDLVQIPTDENGHVAIVKAAVSMKYELPEPSGTHAIGPFRIFECYGDASPKNVGPKIASALIRMAETRAKARALRDATNLGDPIADDVTEEAPEDPSRGDAFQTTEGKLLRRVDLIAKTGALIGEARELSVPVPHEVSCRLDTCTNANLYEGGKRLHRLIGAHKEAVKDAINGKEEAP